MVICNFKKLLWIFSKIQPDMEELDGHMEENEKEQREEAKEEIKLGRIQYRLDYDFQQNQVYTSFKSFISWYFL